MSQMDCQLGGNSCQNMETVYFLGECFEGRRAVEELTTGISRAREQNPEKQREGQGNEGCFTGKDDLPAERL